MIVDGGGCTFETECFPHQSGSPRFENEQHFENINFQIDNAVTITVNPLRAWKVNGI